MKGLEFDGAGWDDDDGDMEADDDEMDEDDEEGGSSDDEGDLNLDEAGDGAEEPAATTSAPVNPVQAAESLLKYHGGDSIEVGRKCKNNRHLRRRRPSHFIA